MRNQIKYVIFLNECVFVGCVQMKKTHKTTHIASHNFHKILMEMVKLMRLIGKWKNIV